MISTAKMKTMMAARSSIDRDAKAPILAIHPDGSLAVMRRRAAAVYNTNSHSISKAPASTAATLKITPVTLLVPRCPLPRNL